MATAWWAAVGIPTTAVVALAVGAAAVRCQPDEVDCSWGFEYLLAVPAALLAAVLVAPPAVWWALRRRHDPHATATGWWCVAVGVLLVPTCIGALVAPLVARWLALRGAGRRTRREERPGGLPGRG